MPGHAGNNPYEISRTEHARRTSGNVIGFIAANAAALDYIEPVAFGFTFDYEIRSFPEVYKRQLQQFDTPFLNKV
jgi:hypothetical protein